MRDNIYTVPNLLTVSRIIACPVLGLAIVNDNFYLATGLLVYAGLTDLVCSPFSACPLIVRLSSFFLLLCLARSTGTSRAGSTCSPSWAPSSTRPRTRSS